MHQYSTWLVSSVLLLHLAVSLACAADSAARLHSAPAVLQVCTSKACRKQGAPQTLVLLRSLASTARATSHPAWRGPWAQTAGTAPSAAAVSASFAESVVETCGCLGRCGWGPNVVSTATGEVFCDVFKPVSARALLEAELSLSVPEEASKASVKRIYAQRARQRGELLEAHSLITSALNLLGGLRARAASMLSELLLERADVSEDLGDLKSATADRERASAMQQLEYEPELEGAHAAA